MSNHRNNPIKKAPSRKNTSAALEVPQQYPMIHSSKSNLQESHSPHASQIAQAIGLVESGDWDLAAKICLPIWRRSRYGDEGPFMLGDDPDSPYRIVDEDEMPWEVPYIIGSAHLYAGNTVSAEFYFEWLSRAAPSLPEGLYMLGNVAIARGDDQEAASIFRRLLTGNPAHAGGHRQLAETLLRVGNRKDAKIHFRYAFALQPNNAELKKRIDEVTELIGDQAAEIISHPGTNPEEKLLSSLAMPCAGAKRSWRRRCELAVGKLCCYFVTIHRFTR